ncbi:hypothetical protein AAEX28_05160 [Lentisphaerota bacterium WC36G]|nr:hypothetical protein LJT99_08015 [Lentisphaerae bacterium WC36]
MKNIRMESPSTKSVRHFLKKWDKSENYLIKEKCLNKLFKEQYKYNHNVEEVLTKVCCLNELYSIKIKAIDLLGVTNHIVSLNVDEHINNNDYSLVNDISNWGGNKYYCFATKFCSFQRPEAYPIYDQIVNNVLWTFKKKDNFFD